MGGGKMEARVRREGGRDMRRGILRWGIGRGDVVISRWGTGRGHVVSGVR